VPAYDAGAAGLGKSEQSVGTDPAFVAAVVSRFGPLSVDLAASESNALVYVGFLTSRIDSLKQPWHEIEGNRWLNPPFSDITPWAYKCYETARQLVMFGVRPPSRTLFLVPASIGSNWFAAYVHGTARVIALNPRLTFVGHTSPYPKDMMLCVYDAEFDPGFDVWRWRK
jgi:hypothetical protein